MGLEWWGGEPKRATGIGVHQSADAERVEWLTPPHVLTALRPFDLDPCAPVKRPWDMAAHHFTIIENGLNHDWRGRVWLNPPYGDETDRWMKRMADHGHGTALIFARTETLTWHRYVWPRATAILFIKGRLTFFSADGKPGRGNGGAPSALIAYGEHDAAVLQASGLAGAFVRLR